MLELNYINMITHVSYPLQLNSEIYSPDNNDYDTSIKI